MFLLGFIAAWGALAAFVVGVTTLDPFLTVVGGVGLYLTYAVTRKELQDGKA